MPDTLPKFIIGPVQNLHDARYAAAMGIEYLVFDTEGPFAHTLEEMIQMRDWLSGPKILLRLGSESAETKSEWIARLQPAAVIATMEMQDAAVAVFQPAMANAEYLPQSCTCVLGAFDFVEIKVLDTPSEIPNEGASTAWWLGAFALTPDSLLDYGACDAFLQAHSLAT